MNAFGRGMNRADLERLVAQFNASYAGTNDAQGRSIPRLALPPHFSFGDDFQSLDFRLSRSFFVSGALALDVHPRSVQPLQQIKP